MREMPLSIGTMHFTGIGGIGMSGIAEVLHNLGYSVQGSDIAENPNVRRLKELGIKVFVGQEAANIEDASIVVISTAIKPDNPELLAARERMLPVVHRAEMLGELMRLKWSIACAGTHGKTTTTSLVAAMLDTAGLDPTVINGGIINAYGTNARLGSGDWMVVEADESDGSFNRLPATIAVVTNIDPEHLDFHGDFDRLQEAFRAFVANIPFYGFATMCIDHPTVQKLIPRVADRRIITYGFSPQADIRAVNLEITPSGAKFDVVIADRLHDSERTLEGLELPMYGKHNVSNALAAIAIGLEMDLSDELIAKALAGFSGVKRRFTKTGETGGITVIDDYGHHPVEISAVLSAARSACPEGRVYAVVQPHRYSRLHDLFEDFCACFNDADGVIVADVYSAGEEPIEGADRDSLASGLRARGHRHVYALNDPAELAGIVAGIAEPGDMVVCLGAGSITNWAQALPTQLKPLVGGAKRVAGKEGQ
ncbi:UDP-N-acetylmuramate--L-alanine ligase [Nisaea acidiphila]|uniref:UDP-N-acetylmuramate--L-alanine ligase n=1 Tax=Nisaea acidiphila TaxID=1862145 RepID=A0A9J7AQC0_9PROT|nr:UDP-N-acetylmuramate--L-alanine ligase [Nisaea acidiphila]UUX49090.1 UDP-N-acetylmuramate--L-alanine ligase [Nisaea acidiphila]